MGVSKESISKFLIGDRFHVKLCILSPYSNRRFYRKSISRKIKHPPIDSLLTPIVESKYLKSQDSCSSCSQYLSMMSYST